VQKLKQTKTKRNVKNFTTRKQNANEKKRKTFYQKKQKKKSGIQKKQKKNKKSFLSQTKKNKTKKRLVKKRRTSFQDKTQTDKRQNTNIGLSSATTYLHQLLQLRHHPGKETATDDIFLAIQALRARKKLKKNRLKVGKNA
jgi:hypothetical protein